MSDKTATAPEATDGWHQPMPEKIPSPTYWPAVLAFGITISLLGLLTAYPISFVGLMLMALGLRKWIGELVHGD